MRWLAAYRVVSGRIRNPCLRILCVDERRHYLATLCIADEKWFVRIIAEIYRLCKMKKLLRQEI